LNQRHVTSFSSHPRIVGLTSGIRSFIDFGTYHDIKNENKSGELSFYPLAWKKKKITSIIRYPVSKELINDHKVNELSNNKKFICELAHVCELSEKNDWLVSLF
jgi:hypothetical protein